VGAGGPGGRASDPAGGDGTPSYAVDGTGGGGGSVGRIFLRAPAGGIDLTGGMVSPLPGQDTIVAQ
jgi:hypothetical protein